jgi:microcompartment protein CcmL/EutN
VTSKALGLIETIGLSAAIEAADAAAKSANIRLLGYENAKGGGRITIKFVGDVGAVKAAVAAGSAAALRVGRVESCLVIPRPHEEIEALIGQVDRGQAVKPAAPTPPGKGTTTAKAAKPKAAASKTTPAKKPKPQAAKPKTPPPPPFSPQPEPVIPPAPTEPGQEQPAPDHPEEPTETLAGAGQP